MFITAVFSYFVVLGNGPDHVDSHPYMYGSHFRTGRVHHNPGGTWCAGNVVLNTDCQQKHTNRIVLPLVSPHTLSTVSTDALPDDELPLPQHAPDQVTWATADLDHLPRHRHLLPAGAFRVVVVDAISEPHLDGARETDIQLYHVLQVRLS